MTDAAPNDPFQLSNVKRFIAFRVCFNARFYYPIFTILFLDFGLTLEQFAILNAIWAITIVGLEVPSGALADTIGRRNLVVAASVLMVVEMALLVFAPIGATPLIFYLFALNRMLSGAAEAAASGADEALAYDTLKEHGMESAWGRVLERQMRLQSIAFVLAMSSGAVLYDYERLNALFSWLGADLSLAKETAMRLPLIGTLLLSLGALAATLGMREPAENEPSGSSLKAVKRAFANTLSAGTWILKTPLALVVICAGMLFDHVARMVLTLNSEFYRQIDLPEYSFGFIGAGLAMIGIVMPKVGEFLADHRSKVFNFLFLAVCLAAGLWLMARFVPYWSALPMVLVYAGVSLNGYFVSHYLNQITDSRHRATVLSFKGLSFNLAYGAIGYLYATTIAQLRENERFQAMPQAEREDALFQTVFAWSPAYFLAMAAVTFLFAFYKLRIKEPEQT